MKRLMVFTALYLLWATPSFGTEIELTRIRNPFDFGKGGTYSTGEAEGKGGLGKAISRLGMIVAKDDVKFAIIDGNTYKVGDVIEGSKITSITIDYVELESTYKTWRMYVEIPEEE